MFAVLNTRGASSERDGSSATLVNLLIRGKQKEGGREEEAASSHAFLRELFAHASEVQPANLTPDLPVSLGVPRFSQQALLAGVMALLPREEQTPCITTARWLWSMWVLQRECIVSLSLLLQKVGAEPVVNGMHGLLAVSGGRGLPNSATPLLFAAFARRLLEVGYGTSSSSGGQTARDVLDGLCCGRDHFSGTTREGAAVAQRACLAVLAALCGNTSHGEGGGCGGGGGSGSASNHELDRFCRRQLQVLLAGARIAAAGVAGGTVAPVWPQSARDDADRRCLESYYSSVFRHLEVESVCAAAKCLLQQAMMPPHTDGGDVASSHGPSRYNWAIFGPLLRAVASLGTDARSALANACTGLASAAFGAADGSVETERSAVLTEALLAMQQLVAMPKPAATGAAAAVAAAAAAAPAAAAAAAATGLAVTPELEQYRLWFKASFGGVLTQQAPQDVAPAAAAATTTAATAAVATEKVDVTGTPTAPLLTCRQDIFLLLEVLSATVPHDSAAVLRVHLKEMRVHRTEVLGRTRGFLDLARTRLDDLEGSDIGVASGFGVNDRGDDGEAASAATGAATEAAMEAAAAELKVTRERLGSYLCSFQRTNAIPQALAATIRFDPPRWARLKHVLLVSPGDEAAVGLLSQGAEAVAAAECGATPRWPSSVTAMDSSLELRAKLCGALKNKGLLSEGDFSAFKEVVRSFLFAAEAPTGAGGVGALNAARDGGDGGSAAAAAEAVAAANDISGVLARLRKLEKEIERGTAVPDPCALDTLLGEFLPQSVLASMALNGALGPHNAVIIAKNSDPNHCLHRAMRLLRRLLAAEAAPQEVSDLSERLSNLADQVLHSFHRCASGVGGALARAMAALLRENAAVVNAATSGTPGAAAGAAAASELVTRMLTEVVQVLATVEPLARVLLERVETLLATSADRLDPQQMGSLAHLCSLWPADRQGALEAVMTAAADAAAAGGPAPTLALARFGVLYVRTALLHCGADGSGGSGSKSEGSAGDDGSKSRSSASGQMASRVHVPPSLLSFLWWTRWRLGSADGAPAGPRSVWQWLDEALSLPPVRTFMLCVFGPAGVPPASTVLRLCVKVPPLRDFCAPAARRQLLLQFIGEGHNGGAGGGGSGGGGGGDGCDRATGVIAFMAAHRGIGLAALASLRAEDAFAHRHVKAPDSDSDAVLGCKRRMARVAADGCAPPSLADPRGVCSAWLAPDDESENSGADGPGGGTAAAGYLLDMLLDSLQQACCDDAARGGDGGGASRRLALRLLESAVCLAGTGSRMLPVLPPTLHAAWGRGESASLEADGGDRAEAAAVALLVFRRLLAPAVLVNKDAAQRLARQLIDSVLLRLRPLPPSVTATALRLILTAATADAIPATAEGTEAEAALEMCPFLSGEAVRSWPHVSVLLGVGKATRDSWTARVESLRALAAFCLEGGRTSGNAIYPDGGTAADRRGCSSPRAAKRRCSEDFGNGSKGGSPAVVIDMSEEENEGGAETKAREVHQATEAAAVAAGVTTAAKPDVESFHRAVLALPRSSACVLVGTLRLTCDGGLLRRADVASNRNECASDAASCIELVCRVLSSAAGRVPMAADAPPCLQSLLRVCPVFAFVEAALEQITSSLYRAPMPSYAPAENAAFADALETCAAKVLRRNEALLAALLRPPFLCATGCSGRGNSGASAAAGNTSYRADADAAAAGTWSSDSAWSFAVLSLLKRLCCAREPDAEVGSGGDSGGGSGGDSGSGKHGTSFGVVEVALGHYAVVAYRGLFSEAPLGVAAAGGGWMEGLRTFVRACVAGAADTAAVAASPLGRAAALVDPSLFKD